MQPVKPPPLLPCLNEAACLSGLSQGTFRELFGYLYVDCPWFATVPGHSACRVRFRPRHFEHAFYKEAEAGEARVVWQPDRAERLLWIGYTLEQPTQTYRVGERRHNFFCRMADPEAPWYLVVTDLYREHELDFVTAYPLGHHSYSKMSKHGKRIK